MMMRDRNGPAIYGARSVTVFGVAGLLGAGVVMPAHAGERIDIYDKYSRREGYVIVSERPRRMDFYDVYSRWKGYATIRGPRQEANGPKNQTPKSSGRALR